MSDSRGRRRRGVQTATAVAALAVGILPSGALQAQISVPEIKVVNDQHVNVLAASDYAATMEISEPLLTLPGGDGDVQYIRYLSKAGAWRDNFKYVIDASEPSSISVLLGGEMHVFSTMYPTTTINGVEYLGDGRGNALGSTTVNGAFYWKYMGKDGMTVLLDPNLNAAMFVQFPSGLTRTYYYKERPNVSPPSVRIRSIVQSDGTMIKFTYDTDDANSTTGAWYHVASVALINQAYAYCDPMADHCAFSFSTWPSASFSGPPMGYAPSGQTALEFATTNTGYGRTYRKDMYGRVVGIANKHNSPEDLTISYQGTSWGVTQIVNGQGDVRTYTATPSGGNYTLNVRSSYLNASDVYHFNDNTLMGMPSSMVDRNGRQFSYSWSIPDRNPLSFTYPEGNKETFQYDSRFNITTRSIVPKPGFGASSLSESASFDVSCLNIYSCNQPNTYVDPKGNQTDYTYTSFGGKASELGPEPSPGAARPLKLYTYIQKSAYILNSSGALVPTGQPIWKLDGETTCQSAPGSNVPTCDSSAVRTDTSYIYGAAGTPDTLLVHGKLETSAGSTRLTCYGYDRLRRKISETAPNANLQVCP